MSMAAIVRVSAAQAESGIATIVSANAGHAALGAVKAAGLMHAYGSARFGTAIIDERNRLGLQSPSLPPLCLQEVYC